MMIRLVGIILIFLVSCSSGKEISKTEKQPKPEWTFQRPLNSANYIGVGFASKLTYPTDYSVIARKNALSDMSSEITVQISGESFFHTIDRNNKYTDEFQSMIKSSFKEEIEDYDIVDTWESETEYWIYTKISKSKHQEIKSAKKKKVLDQAYDNYLRGQNLYSENNPADALDLLTHALIDLKEYWAENNVYNTGEEEIHLDNAIYGLIREVCSSIELKVSESAIDLNYENKFNSSISLAVNNGNGYLAGIPIKYKFSTNTYTRAKRLYTNDDGIVSIHVENMNRSSKGFYLETWVDFEELIKNGEESEMEELILQSLNPNRITTPINITLPKIYFLPSEGDETALAETMKNELQKNDFTIVSNPELADLEMKFTSSTRSGGSTQGFRVAFLDFTMSLYNAENHTEIYADSYTNIKGLHMNVSGAIGDATNNGAKKIRKEIVPKMIEILL